jgi:hypothetical protein
MRPLGELANFALPATYKNRSAPGAKSCKQIGNAVSDHIAFRKRHLQIGSCLFQQADFGLTAMAALPKIAQLCLGVMQTIVDTIDSGTACMNLRKHGPLKCLQGGSFQVPLGDSGLVGNYRNAQAEVIEKADRLGNSRQKFELRTGEWRINHPSFLVMNQGVDYAIAIEENSSHLKWAAIFSALCVTVLTDGSMGESELIVLIVVTMVVCQTAIAGNHVKYNFASFEVETEL